MDNYKMEDIEKLIENNLLTPDILKNILKSTTRRIENYDDKDAVKILKYLSSHEVVPEEIKEEINKYLSEYNTYKIDSVENSENKGKESKIKIIVLYSLILVLLVILLFLLARR